MLCAIHLNVRWLQSAISFGHHNMKKGPPGGRTNKQFWTKANLSAYLRSCSCTGRLIDAIYLSAKNADCEVIHASYATKGWMGHSDNIQENQNNNNGIYKSGNT